MNNFTSVEIPDIMDESDGYSLEQVCEICNVDQQQVMRMVDLGVYNLMEIGLPPGVLHSTLSPGSNAGAGCSAIWISILPGSHFL